MSRLVHFERSDGGSRRGLFAKSRRHAGARWPGAGRWGGEQPPHEPPGPGRRRGRARRRRRESGGHDGAGHPGHAGAGGGRGGDRADARSRRRVADLARRHLGQAAAGRRRDRCGDRPRGARGCAVAPQRRAEQRRAARDGRRRAGGPRDRTGLRCDDGAAAGCRRRHLARGLPPVLADRAPLAADTSRRSFLLASGTVAAASLLGVVGARVLGRGQDAVETTRRLLRLPVGRGAVPAGAEWGSPT